MKEYFSQEEIDLMSISDKSIVNRGRSKCHPKRPQKAFGLCSACYQRDAKKLGFKKIKKENECGHLDKSYGGQGLCKNCYDKYLKKINPQYKERQKINNRKWIDENKERLSKSAQEYRRKKEKDPDFLLKRRKAYWSNKLKRYEFTISEYNQLFKLQEGRCQICKTELDSTIIKHLDHDHITNRVRGFLCHGCNWGLGFFDDNIEGIKRALEYLENPPAKFIYERKEYGSKEI